MTLFSPRRGSSRRISSFIWPLGLLFGVLILVTACAGGSTEVSDAEAADPEPSATASTPPEPVNPNPVPPQPAPASQQTDEFGEPPAVPSGPLGSQLAEDLETIWDGLQTGISQPAIQRLGESQDARVAWLIADLLRFIVAGEVAEDLVRAAEEMTGLEQNGGSPAAYWLELSNHLIAWDLPAPPDYADYKARLFTLVEPGWQPFFDDVNSEIDWRWVTWGGVFIDSRELGNPLPCPRGCIPALDDPAVTDASGGAWYPDDAIVFGLLLNGEARAYPKNIMEVHEMVNDTLGGRRIGMPYCTLCGSAQAYFTDTVGDENLVLRTSGLLSRSNKVMYELDSKSVFDTFTGKAVSGPLREAGVQLEEITVVTSTWSEWKAAHPDTTIIAPDGGIGREYPSDPLRGRDDDGPIFAVGDVDPRLPAQEHVLGVVIDGEPIAFPVNAARTALDAGEIVELSGVQLEVDGDGLRARSVTGEELVSHQAFWFAWSQFHPETALWTPLSS